MNGIETALVCNVAIIFGLAALIGVLAGEDGVERLAAAFGVGWVLTSISISGWFIYVIVHFVGKFW